MPRTAVVALGGNAITREGQSGTHSEQAANARAMAAAVCSLRDAGWQVVLVHGNGPQVGNLVIQQDEAAHEVPPLPLFCLDAMTEGQLGSLLTLALHEQAGDTLPGVVSVVTHVVVSPDDPAFTHPAKPIGPFLDREQADRLAAGGRWQVAEDAGRGYRRVVASPQPLDIVETEAIRALVDRGMIVTAAGGGGVPVVAEGRGYRGIDAVIDKDLAAQQLAQSLDAGALVLVTDVDQVLLDFGSPQQRPVTELTADEAQRHLDDGQFPEGSMGPKVRAAIGFVRGGGQAAVITSAQRAVRSLDGEPHPDDEVGTRIVAERVRLEGIS
ncbi:MAG: carbamate kinase [Pseudonocardiaceae bacterium]|nr:carbamate kinase [Pseudonocardiaceae bacterium]